MDEIQTNEFLISECLEIISQFYELEVETASQLALRYKKNDKCVMMDEEKQIKDYGEVDKSFLVMYYKKGELKEEDVSCDSDFMLNAIPEEAQKWRAIGTRFGVPTATTMFINMDNAGGHGTGNAIDTYTSRCL